MFFDTDILIFVQRGREEAVQLIEDSAELGKIGQDILSKFQQQFVLKTK